MKRLTCVLCLMSAFVFATPMEVKADHVRGRVRSGAGKVLRRAGKVLTAPFRFVRNHGLGGGC